MLASTYVYGLKKKKKKNCSYPKILNNTTRLFCVRKEGIVTSALL